MTARVLEAVALAGEHVELQPMSLDHVPGLVAAYEPGTMDLFSRTDDVLEPLDDATASSYVAEALDGHGAGEYLPFRSQAAIAKLGARRDGVLRRDRRQRDGRVRDTVCFSILAEEWPAVRAGLEQRVAREADS